MYGYILYIKGKRTTDMISRWIKSLSKAIGKQRQQHGLKVIETLASESPTETTAQFLSNANLLAKLHICIANLRYSNSFEGRSRDIKLLTAYAASVLLYRNSQRSGVIQNLTLDEFRKRRRVTHNDENRMIISCVNHKTGAQGFAQLVVTPKGEDVLLQYHTLVRSNITPKPGCEDLLFLTHKGSRYNQVFRKICEAININNIDVTVPPPPSTFRIGMATKVAKNLADNERRGVIKHMSHSEYTSEKYYEFANTQDAVEAFDNINNLM